MNFDERMKKRAQSETWTASASARAKLAQTMQQAQPKPKRQGLRVLAAGVAAALAVLVLSLPTQEPMRSIAGPEGLTSPVPVTQVEGSIEFTVQNRGLHAQATFANHTGDIWLIRWWAQPEGDAQALRQPTGLIWLETGITFHDSAAWSSGAAGAVHWGYEAYRVTAGVLHWVDGDWLLPGQEGYEGQQELIEDAFLADALILSPGDWPEGTAGEMQLVLPDSVPEADALAYYLREGMLELDGREEGVSNIG